MAVSCPTALPHRGPPSRLEVQDPSFFEFSTLMCDFLEFPLNSIFRLPSGYLATLQPKRKGIFSKMHFLFLFTCHRHVI